YMSLEVWKGDSVTTKSDVYSLGVLAYQMLTNRFPFDGESMMQIMYQHLEGEIEEPIDLNPNVPRKLNELVLSMLEIDPQLRPALSEVKSRFLELELKTNKSLAEAALLNAPLEIQRERTSTGVYNFKITNLKPNSFAKEGQAPELVSKGRNWETITKLKSFKKVQFSTIKFLIAYLISITLIISLVFVSDSSSGFWHYFLDLQNQLELNKITQNYFFHLFLFAFLLSLPVFTILFSTVKFLQLVKKFLISMISLGLLLIVINYSYVSTYVTQSAVEVPLFSPIFMGYLELTFPKAIQHLIDAVLLIPVASEAFVSPSNSWNQAMVEIFNQPPLFWIFHYNLLILIVFLILIINRTNLQFFQIAPNKRYWLALILFALFVIEPQLKGLLLSTSVWE
ncbi:MAG: serine/threonine-protein kinase, partial [Candidatus Paceibacterota bacterium]